MPHPLAPQLLAYCNESQRAILARVPAFEELLRTLYARGAAAWPGLSLSEQAWCAHLALHISPADAQASDLGQLWAEDFYLVAACTSEGASTRQRAQATLAEHFLGDLSHALTGIRLDAALAADVEQMVRARLLIGEEGQPAKLALYSGRGPLRAWIRVVTARLALGLVRAKRPQALDDSLELEKLASEDDPELEGLRARYQDIFRRSVTEAMEAMAPEERNLLRLHHLDGLSIDELSTSMNIHRATVARRVARIRETLFSHTREILSTKLSLSPTEFRSLMGHFLSDLDVSVRRILGGNL